MSNQFRKIFDSVSMSAALSSGEHAIPNQAELLLAYAASGSPTGALKVQGKKPDDTFEDLLEIDFAGAGGVNCQPVSILADRAFKVIYTPTAHSQINTLTLSAALVTSNTISVFVDGVAYKATYSGSSDATLQALATALAAAPNVASATVTVVGGTQVGTDDRVITLTFSDGASHTVRDGLVVAGAGQASVTIATSQAASDGTLSLGMLVRS